jgi:hypothetical protein
MWMCAREFTSLLSQIAHIGVVHIISVLLCAFVIPGALELNGQPLDGKLEVL